ncbi:MAG: hypothetical protein GXP37_02640 [Chloroflexi bacterium]|nr:hypothetical protein [Chloroflexota bacterium]
MKQALLFIITAAVVTLVGVVSYRLSVDALALIVGVLLGILALVPTLILSGIVLRRTLAKKEGAEAQGMRMSQQPPVIVVSGGYPPAMMSPNQMAQPQNALMPPPSHPQRRFSMLGFESADAMEEDDAGWAQADAGVI